ncbi:MAG: glycerol-3-phosphate dehydrogenase, partial [Mesorhizobium sp.]
AKLKTAYPFLDARLARRLTRFYGTRARMLLGLARSNADLGRHFGADLYEAEVRYLVQNEWAMTAEDVLWRRTKRGLQLSREQAAALDEFMRGISRRHVAAAE